MIQAIEKEIGDNTGNSPEQEKQRTEQTQTSKQPMKRILLYSEDEKKEGLKQSAEALLNAVQNVIDNYKVAGLPGRISIDEIIQLKNSSSDVKEFIVTKLTERKPIKIMGMTLSTKKAAEIMELPEGSEGLIRAIETLRARHDDKQLDKLLLQEKDKIQIDRRGLAYMMADLNVYTSNEDQVIAYEALKAIEEHLNKIWHIHKRKGFGHWQFTPGDISEAFNRDAEKDFVLRPGYIIHRFKDNSNQ